jgi:hypothetical protein
MRACYFASGVVGEVTPADSSDTVLLEFANAKSIDRVVIREDQTAGQAILGWEVRGETTNGTWRVLANGSSVGNKWITLLPNNVTVTALKAVVTASAPGAQGKIRSTSGHLCTRAPKGVGCTLRQNWQGDGVGKSTKYEWSKSASECCTACTAVACHGWPWQSCEWCGHGVSQSSCDQNRR